ncbi:MAG: prephenate dehydrogenase/arogenate dehydrogenase family protein [Cytophagales bacterium]|nr:prephenate dehydrogenase/arogenate dehydrogenase family protein [Cytophagales bacterium]
MKKFKQLGLIGCGMMGGSFAKALRRAGLVERIVGYSKSPTNTEHAKRLGIVDEAAASALQAVMGSDLILVAVPVSATGEVFKAFRLGLSKDSLVMDVGSTKQDVIATVEVIFGELPTHFVPAHPIAGKAGAGIEEAEVDLYTDRRVILTPTARTHEDAIAKARALWQALDTQVFTMTAAQHDGIFAAVSHLPHLLAFAYIHGIAGQADAQQFLHMAGPGFRDFTRIAGGDVDVWRDIFLANRNEILKQLAITRTSIEQMEKALQSSQSKPLRDLIEVASVVRNGWSINKSMTQHV